MAFNFFKKKPENNTPDFSTIDSNEKAIALFKENKLAKLHLMPLGFGGGDVPQNTMYAPEVAVVLKRRCDAMIGQLLKEGKNLRYSAQPAYKGNSFIPSAIQIQVTGDVDFTETIEIW